MAERADNCSGQATVEAALLVPVVLTLVALLVQPACALYTRSVMAGTAAEVARLVATTRGSDGDVRDYALRRLAAVPDVSVFHEGGPEAWEVEAEGPGDDGRVTVRIEGSVRPLPLLGALVSALGPSGDGCVTLRAEATLDARSEWVRGSYEEWIGIWG